jgi:hypothetical protein
MRNVVFKTNTDKKSVVVCFTCILFFCALISLMTVQTKVYNTTYYVLVLFFSFFIVLALIELIKYKVFSLTREALYIKKYFLFREKVYNIRDISSITESPFKIEVLVRGSKHLIHEGKQIHIYLEMLNETLTFNTFELKSYEEFVKQINLLYMKKDFKREHFDTYDSSSLYIIFAILLLIIIIGGAIRIYYGFI